MQPAAPIEPTTPTSPAESAEAASPSDSRRAELCGAVPSVAPPIRWHWWLLLGPLALAPTLLVVVQLGRWHPDEIFQFIEPAFYYLHGHGVRTWEWDVGLRNWAVPLLLAGIMRFAQDIGATDPQVQRALIAIPQLLLHGMMLVAVMRYAQRRLDSSGWPAVVLSMLLVGLYAPVILFAGRTMGESISAPMLVLAFERLDRLDSGDGHDDRHGAWAGWWLGLSVVVRYGSAVFVLATLVWLIATRRWRALLTTCLTGWCVAVGLGLLDHFTWGSLWHSLREYVHFNAISGEAGERFGAHPAWYYLPLMTIWPAAWVWPGAVMETMRQRRLPLPIFASLCYLAAITINAHKEERFLYPAAIVLVATTAPGLIGLLVRVFQSRTVRAAACAVALLAGMAGFIHQPDFQGDLFRATVRVSRDEATTGVLFSGSWSYATGGSMYLGKEMPWFASRIDKAVEKIARTRPEINRAIATHGFALRQLQSAGFRVVGAVGRQIILERPSARTGERPTASGAAGR